MPSPVGPRAPAPPAAAPRTGPAPDARPHHDGAVQPVERPIGRRLLLLPRLLRAGAGEGAARSPPGAPGWDPGRSGARAPQPGGASQGLEGQGSSLREGAGSSQPHLWAPSRFRGVRVPAAASGTRGCGTAFRVVPSSQEELSWGTGYRELRPPASCRSSGERSGPCG